MSPRSAPIPGLPPITPAPRARARRRCAPLSPNAAIVRPSIVFGPEDDFVNRFAGMISRLPYVPVIRADTRFQPVWVVDIAKAVAKLALTPAGEGETFELGGPQSLSMLDLHKWIADATAHHPTFVAVPDAAARRDGAVRLPAAGAAYLGSVADAPARQCRAQEREDLRRSRHRANAARRGRAQMAGALPHPWPLQPQRRLRR